MVSSFALSIADREPRRDGDQLEVDLATLHRVAVLLPDTAGGAQLVRGAAGRATVVFCGDARELVEAAVSPVVVAAVVALHDAVGAPQTELVRALRRRRPDLTIVVASPGATTHTSRDVLDAGRAGADRLMIRGFDDPARVIAEVLERLSATGGVGVVLARLRPHLSAGALRIVTHTLRLAGDDPSLHVLAAALGISARTLARHVACEGLPTPGALIDWCRVLLAAQRIEATDGSVLRIAGELGFSSATALRRVIRRFTGLRPTELRARGSLTTAIDAFVSACGDPATS